MASNISYHNWTAPALDHLDFTTNCTLAGEWASTWYDGDTGVKASITAAYFRASLPTEIKYIPTAGQLFDWYVSCLGFFDQPFANGSNLFTEQVLNRPWEKCKKEMCKGIPWEGNPDLIGIGIMVSYYTQAFLCTLFGIFIVWNWFMQQRKRSLGPRLRHLVDSFRATTGLFIDAAQLFTLAVIVAALYSSFKPQRSWTEISLAREVSFFSVAATLFLIMLDALTHEQAKRKAGRWSVYILIVSLWMIEGNAGWFLHPKDSKAGWETRCAVTAYHQQKVVSSGLARFWLAAIFSWIILLYLMPKFCSKKFPKMTKRLLDFQRDYGTLILAIATAILTWASLINVTIARQRFLSLASDNVQTMVWTFGQVVAVCTWLPVLVELYYLLRRGIGPALEDRIPEPWTVVCAETLTANVAEYSDLETGPAPAPQVTITGGDHPLEEDQIELLPQTVQADDASGAYTALAVNDGRQRSVSWRSSASTLSRADRTSEDLSEQAFLRSHTA